MYLKLIKKIPKMSTCILINWKIKDKLIQGDDIEYDI